MGAGQTKRANKVIAVTRNDVKENHCHCIAKTMRLEAKSNPLVSDRLYGYLR